MTQLATNTNIAVTTGLSVSYKSPAAVPGQEYSPEATIITDTHFNIAGFNDTAAAIYGFNNSVHCGQQLFDLVKFELIGTSLTAAVKNLFLYGYWKGDVIYKQAERKLVFSTHCTIIKNEQHLPSSIIISTQPICLRVQQDQHLLQAENKYQTLVESLSEGVMLINQHGIIEASNKKASEIVGFEEGTPIGRFFAALEWVTLKEDGSLVDFTEFPALVTLQTGKEFNNVVIGLERSTNRKTTWLTVTSRGIFEEAGSQPTAVVLSFFEITEIKKVNEQLAQSESMFSTFMSNSPTLGWIFDEEGKLVYGNPRFMEIVGLTPCAIGENIAGLTHLPQVLATISKRNRQVIKLCQPVIVEEEITDKRGICRYYLSHWFLLPRRLQGKQLVGGHAVEITDKKRAQQEIDKIYERYHFAINASFNAIWDMDCITGSIYRSDSFGVFSGYTREDVVPAMNWFIEKIHPMDRGRIKSNIADCLEQKITKWENEYRFQVADGSYRHLLDRAHAIYNNGKAVRVIGAMQDITERKKLEAQLLHEQVQKQKMINQATITAQEKERNRISGELHDNVNQLIMSAKLHVCVAKNKGTVPNELLEKANDYLLMAVEEIRDLSKTLTSTLINHVGLQKSIADIGATMLLIKNIQLHTYIREEVVAKLSPEQQLMVYRIIQEQSNNILKYADTNEAIISLKQVNHQVELIISDNGKGFDKTAQKANGIGFINIFNRVDAYNGQVDIITSPGNGCTLMITFPLNEAVADR